MLYTTNFAFIGLHEAAAATGDPRIKAAEDELAEFLCRIQIRSEKHPFLDGGWFRAFDFDRWEFWASNADAGWGAWSIESGWTCGWINAVLAMRQTDTSLWDLGKKCRIGRHHAKWRKRMIPDAVVESIKPIELKTRRPRQARHGNRKAVPLLLRRRHGEPDRRPDRPRPTTRPERGLGWGRAGCGVDVVDLGEPKTIKSVGARCLESVKVGVLFPSKIEFFVSNDGKAFKPLGMVTNVMPTGYREPRASRRTSSWWQSRSLHDTSD